MKVLKPVTQYSLAAALALQLVGCGGGGSSDTPPQTPPSDMSKYTSLNGSGSSAVYLDLESGATIGIDQNWHLSYQKYVGFKSNGGISGTAGVSVCVAKKYDALYDASGAAVKAEFEKLNRGNTLAGFNGVSKDSCAATDYQTDAITTQIKTEDWLAYDTGVGIYSAKAGNGWIIRSATKVGGTDHYARVKVQTVTVVSDPAESRKIVLAVEKWNGSTFDAPADSPEMDFTNGRQYWDLETNTLVGETDDWELSIKADGRDFPIQVNGGASGTGAAGVGALQLALGAINNPTDTTQVYKYFGDTASGALSTPGSFGPFHYGVGGGHDMWPTFAVYLFKTTDDRYFKAQVVSNTGADGTAASGNLYIRYEEVR